MNVLSHAPVLLEQAIAALAIKKNGFYVDATFGRGSHTRAILQKLEENGRILVMDRDPQAAEYAEAHFQNESRFELVSVPFSQIGRAHV